jgi:hypothetical protein
VIDIQGWPTTSAGIAESVKRKWVISLSPDRTLHREECPLKRTKKLLYGSLVLLEVSSHASRELQLTVFWIRFAD